MPSPTFGLYGIGGVYNYGCEAIIRGSVVLLRREWPDCRIVYVSRRHDADKNALLDLGLDIVPEQPRVSLPRRGFNSAMRRVGLSFRLPVPGSFYWLKDGIDCVLSIGGDIYTLWHGQESATRFYQVDQARQVFAHNIPLVLWGGSVGPYESNPFAVEAFTEILRKMALITVRESWSKNYLQRLGINDVVRLVADPAYLMSVESLDAAMDEHQPTNPTIAVNLSPLSVSYGYGQERQAQALMHQARMVAQLVGEYDMNVLLVPHVICPWQPEDDDYGYLHMVKQHVPPGVQSRVTLLPPDLGARRTKRIMASCQALIAARLHCCIAGMSTCVPTLLLSYSPKSIGMSEYVYGNHDWVLPVDSDTGVLVSRVGAMLSSARELSGHLCQRMGSIQQDALQAGQYLRWALSTAAN